jgi:hypothetical protein
MLKYNEFKAKKEQDANVVVNEGILGKALGALKDKFALSISKRIGGAKKIDKLIDQRKIELQDIMKTKLKLEEELLLAKRAFEDSDGDENLRTQYEQKKKAVSGQMGAINKKEKASRRKFDVELSQLKKDNELVSNYAELQVANMGMELANIEMEAYKKMGRDTSKLEKKISSQAEVIEAKKSEIKKALQKKKEEAKDVIKVTKDNVYDYVNSKGVQLSVKVLDAEADKEGFIKVVNVEKEGESEGFRVKAEDLKPGKDTKEEAPEGEEKKEPAEAEQAA